MPPPNSKLSSGSLRPFRGAVYGAGLAASGGRHGGQRSLCSLLTGSSGLGRPVIHAARTMLVAAYGDTVARSGTRCTRGASLQRQDGTGLRRVGSPLRLVSWAASSVGARDGGGCVFLAGSGGQAGPERFDAESGGGRAVIPVFGGPSS